MTREEAINLLADMDSDKYTAKEAVALTMAIKALEKEPICPSHGIDCEDCPAYDPRVDAIIRAEVKRIIDGIPKQRTGHWIMSDDGLYRPICDKCGAHPWKGYIPTVEEATEVFKYCPNCGAKMDEPQEIEELDFVQDHKKVPVTLQVQKYCDRNICIQNEYNGIGCDDCKVAKD